MYGVPCYPGVPTYYVYHTLRLNQGKSEPEDLTTKSAPFDGLRAIGTDRAQKKKRKSNCLSQRR
jgi:hypothetical protein